MRVTLLLCLALLVIPVTKVHAENNKADKARRAKAEKLREQGFKLADKRKYRKAVEVLEQVLALGLNSDPDLLYALGALTEGYKDYRKAALYYQGYLYTMPDEAGQKRVKPKLELCFKMTQTGTVDFNSKPDGIEVRINNVIVGRTPVSALKLPAGNYSLNASHELYRNYKDTLTIEHEQNQRIRLQLEKKIFKGDLNVQVTPPKGAVVYLNHVRVGGSPYNRKGLPTRRYLVHVEKPGWDRWVRYVTIEKQQTTTVLVTLEKTGTNVPVPPLPKN